MNRIKAYLCNKKISALSVDPAVSQKRIAIDENKITAYLQPRNYKPAAGMIVARVLTESAALETIECLILKYKSSLKLRWEREAPDPHSAPNDFVTLWFYNPDMPCWWITTFLSSSGAGGLDSFWAELPDRSGGIIPTSGSKKDFYHITQSRREYFQGISFVPGDTLDMIWMMKFDGKIYQKLISSAYFASPAIVGGRIENKMPVPNNDYDVFSIAIFGERFSIIPTDFADYQIGDWVFILKTGPSEAKKTDKNTGYGQSNVASEIINNSMAPMKLLPIKVNELGLDGSNFESKSYSMETQNEFKRFFEINYFTGTILSIGDNDTARVDIDDIGTRDDVPIFYHCENSGDVLGGSDAFMPNDRVIILNEYGEKAAGKENLTIIGFIDEPKMCESTFLLINLEDEYILWSLKDNKLFPMPDDDGKETQPLSASAMGQKLSSMGLSSSTALSVHTIPFTKSILPAWDPEKNQLEHTASPSGFTAYLKEMPHPDYDGQTIQVFEQNISDYKNESDDSTTLNDVDEYFDSFFKISIHGFSRYDAIAVADLIYHDPWLPPEFDIWEWLFGGESYEAVSQTSIDIQNIVSGNPYSAGIAVASTTPSFENNRRPAYFSYEKHREDNGHSKTGEMSEIKIDIELSYSYISHILYGNAPFEYKNILKIEDSDDDIFFDEGGSHPSSEGWIRCYNEWQQEADLTIPVTSNFKNGWLAILEQPIIKHPAADDVWGFAKIYFCKGAKVSENWVYNWGDLVEINMNEIFSLFSQTFEGDIKARGIYGGLSVSLRSRPAPHQ